MAQTIANRPLSSMSSDVLERNQTVSNMIPRLKAQPNTLRNLGTCRFCGTGLRHTFVDLGMSPPCETILERAQLNQMEAFYPLHVFVCDQCFLVQLQEYVAPEDIFTEYAYFSSYSDSWLAHAKAYAKLMIERSKLNAQSHIVELGSNDGYLLQYFVEAGIPVLGIEPAANVARGAIARGVPTLVKFFSAELAEELARDGMQADLLIGNNVLAQVPDLRGFVKGMKILLRPNGIITLEFPHLMRLIAENQFDTIYHEHFSYFSFLTVKKILAEFGLTVFEVDELPTHGGSLRIYARHEQDNSRPVTLSVRFYSVGNVLLICRKGKRNQAQNFGFSDSGKTGREIGRWLWCARQREHASQLLRHSQRLSRLHCRPKPLQAWKIPGRNTHSGIRHRQDS